MAVNTSRSMNQDLYFGSQVDGRMKTLTPDRGGDVEQQSPMLRARDLQAQYNITDMGHTFNSGCSCGGSCA